jgi:hypothetical protein
VSTSAPQHSGHQTQIHERRSHLRVLPKTLIYVACGESNGGMVLNVSDDGMAISMAIPVGDEAYSSLYVRMNGLAQSIEVRGRMAWTTKSKKRAGIQLVDVSDEQRGHIREWLGQEGVRDVNLLPRVSEPAASILPAFAKAAGSSTLLDKPRPDSSTVASSAAINAEIVEDPRVSLLTGLGGTAPEFLGPAQDEPSFTEDTTAETEHSQAPPNSNFVGFRENEWDLASITMVPRKRSKPEGLSALGLLLLWIAIPSFGIGILVGRRPLQQWLAGAYAMRKNTSRVPAPDPEIVNTRQESAGITGSDIDATGPRSIPTRTVETPAMASSQDVKTSNSTKSLVSTPAFVDTKLLNSMSTQELRALKSPASVTHPGNPNAHKHSTVDFKAKQGAVAKDAFSSAVLRPATPTNTLSTSTSAPTNSDASAQRRDAKDKSAVAPPTFRETPNDQIARAVPVDSGIDAGSTNRHGVADSNVAAPHSSTLNVSPTATPLTASSTTATVLTTAPTETSTTHQNIASPVKSSGPASPKSASGSAFDSTPGIAPDAGPRIAPNVRTSMASTTTPSLYPSASSSRSAPPSAAPNVAPVNAHAPLHGVMLVARKNNESFLLRLPVESVAGGRSVSVEMQRFVIVPAESRWHRHGPIAKLTVGELLTQVAANQVETASNVRSGDAVTVRAFVDKNGSVQDLKPVSGRFALMPQVMHEVREWQFDQTLIDGKPVESEVNITVEFGSGPQVSRSREIQAQNSFKP